MKARRQRWKRRINRSELCISVTRNTLFKLTIYSKQVMVRESNHNYGTQCAGQCGPQCATNCGCQCRRNIAEDGSSIDQ
ncbi:hypothetical protein DEO72_LG11g1904 [Vigna unguiculata]|uniref:Uncharacterized protein n=1 Tax=Vigna unguiculata TaxID=3917 RepID=A0A4D6NNI1_VIGUN|nr:hypothetical protein DEO72_LG11g1904 [Vigna unguiculata]